MTTGMEFNEHNEGVKFVKLTNESSVHNGFKFKEGLNTDTLNFDPREICAPGGLYFCDYKDFGKWIDYGEHKMKYMWDVNVEDNMKIVPMYNNVKCNKFILSNKRSIWNNEWLCLEAVKQNGCALEYVKEQTEEICSALKFVKEQTKEICLEAVKQNGLALEFVKEQTKEICLEAVKQDGLALEFVKE